MVVASEFLQSLRLPCVDFAQVCHEVDRTFTPALSPLSSTCSSRPTPVSAAVFPSAGCRIPLRRGAMSLMIVDTLLYRDDKEIE
jgi:hypothetical protein